VRVFGFEIRRAPPKQKHVVSSSEGWWPLIREPHTGAWQQNREIRVDSIAAHHAVYACVTLIANDVGKLRPKLVQLSTSGIWEEATSPAFAPVLRKPNRFQNHIQFKEWWVTSKLLRGNTYALKERDDRRVVRALYLLDPTRVKVLVAPDGDVFYELAQDNLAGLTSTVTVPASEIIHDRMNCLFHPLVGLSPIFASGLAAFVGMNIQTNATDFFSNGSNPSGILTAPEEIDEPTAKKLSERWNQMYAGGNSGRVAVLGSGLKFEALRMTAVDAQMIEHLQWTAETVASTFHVPKFKIGVGQQPTYQNGELLNQVYYSDCLQSHIEQFELAMDEGLGLTEPKDGRLLGVELDLDALLRMDTATQIKSLAEGVGGAVYTPNEARKKIDLKPLKGGDTVYMQQQNFSLAALDQRDRENPLGKPPAPAPEPEPTAPPEPEELDMDDWERRFAEDARALAVA
jgi:HK97 family phage portal protein